jgi:hypothetical protein
LWAEPANPLVAALAVIFLTLGAAPPAAGDAPYSAPANVEQAIGDQAGEAPAFLQSFACSQGEISRARDDATADTQNQRWAFMRVSQTDFAIEFALCALDANSQDDFESYSGAAASALTQSILADRSSPDRSLPIERIIGARVRAIATWLVANPNVPPSAKSLQSGLLQTLDDLRL